MRVFQCDRCGLQDTNPGSYRNKRVHGANINITKFTTRDPDGDEPTVTREICLGCVEDFDRFMNPTKVVGEPKP